MEAQRFDAVTKVWGHAALPAPDGRGRHRPQCGRGDNWVRGGRGDPFRLLRCRGALQRQERVLLQSVQARAVPGAPCGAVHGRQGHVLDWTAGLRQRPLRLLPDHEWGLLLLHG